MKQQQLQLQQPHGRQQCTQQNVCHQQKFKVQFLLSILCLMATTAWADDYLKEAPSFLQPCKLKDSGNSDCIAKAVENIFTNWGPGVPGLKNLDTIDPFHVKKVHLEQNNPNINMKLDAKDITVTGLSQTKITKASVNNEYKFKFVFKVPKLQTKATYRLKGTILLLHLDGTGPLNIELSDADVVLTMKTQLIEVNNQKFFDVTSIQSHINNIANFHIQLDNLFGGNKELEDSANAVFNENWRDLFDIMRPVLEEMLNAFTIDRFKKIFAFVPANYFFTDLP